MNRFQGIRQEDMWLLAENRFQDSKAFYEDHKPQLRAGILQPIQALFSDMSPEMLKIYPQIVADTMRNGSVSRIRRDNRYTRDKAMYRENMWISFLRDKKAWDNLPGFYLDISLRGSSYGVGVLPSVTAPDADPAPHDRRDAGRFCTGNGPGGSGRFRL